MILIKIDSARSTNYVQARITKVSYVVTGRLQKEGSF